MRGKKYSYYNQTVYDLLREFGREQGLCIKKEYACNNTIHFRSLEIWVSKFSKRSSAMHSNCIGTAFVNVWRQESSLGIARLKLMVLE